MSHVAALLPLMLIVSLASMAAPAAGRPRTIDNADLKYNVTLPSECRIEEGPGTLEAICSPDFDEAKSAEMTAAASLLMEVDAELAPADAKAYGEAEFRREVPEAVCGESEAIKVKLSDVKMTKEGAASLFTARVLCPEIKFLGLPERQAKVQYIIQPGYRYRLMARSLASDADSVKAAVDGFLSSFRSTAEKKS